MKPNLLNKNKTEKLNAINVTDNYVCPEKSKIKAYFNCAFNRKQCKNNTTCTLLSQKCCKTVCGSECMGKIIKY